MTATTPDPDTAKDADPSAETTAPTDLGFTFLVRRNGDVEIFHRNRLATTLRGDAADDFKQEAGEEKSAEAQQLMARVTGNFKHGNERLAGEHPRNKR
jgi:hypothetical protein